MDYNSFCLDNYEKLLLSLSFKKKEIERIYEKNKKNKSLKKYTKNLIIDTQLDYSEIIAPFENIIKQIEKLSEKSFLLSTKRNA